MSNELQSYLDNMPLVAILRGIKPVEAVAVVEAIHHAGFGMVEVPLNSPQPLQSIQRIADAFGDKLLVGAGTVLAPQQVHDVHSAGGKLVVSPNTNIEVIQATAALELISMPGAATPSEAFAAINAGASAVKAFPAEMVTPQVLKSWKSVLPAGLPVLAVGGINPSNLADYWQAGANGFGLGGALYKANKSVDAVTRDAEQFIETMRRVINTTSSR